MRTCLLLAALLPVLCAAQTVTSASQLEIAVGQDGVQTFLWRTVFIGAPVAESAEADALSKLPVALAEKQWCLRGWSIDKKESTQSDRPKGLVITISGACK